MNLDEEVNFKNQKMKLGDRIVDNMKKNPALDWQFVDSEEAERGLKAGKYFAIMEIPREFTNDMLSVTKTGVKKAAIEYKVNEKINAIAPKITDKGAEALKDVITKNLVETISTMSIGTIGDVSNNILDTLIIKTESLIKMIEEAQNNESYKDFNQVIKANIADRVDFIKNPVDIKESKIFQIENYGSAMTPFYSVLAAWVGALILATVLSTSPKGNYRSVDVYFGPLMIFLVISLVQTIIISLGDFFILGVSAKHPILFTGVLVLSGIVFTVLIYSLVTVFGTVGKGMAIFLLVIQIGGSGGTFPVEMTPMFFRSINSIIPFTYAIGACREAIGGIYPQISIEILLL